MLMTRGAMLLLTPALLAHFAHCIYVVTLRCQLCRVRACSVCVNTAKNSQSVSKIAFFTPRQGKIVILGGQKWTPKTGQKVAPFWPKIGPLK